MRRTPRPRHRHAVAAAEWRAGTPVDDPTREAQVVAAAVDADLEPARVTTVVRDQIEVGKVVQRTLITLWRTVPATAPTAPTDLATIRPRITALRTRGCPADLARAVATTTTSHRLDPLHAVALVAASRSLCR